MREPSNNLGSEFSSSECLPRFKDKEATFRPEWEPPHETTMLSDKAVNVASVPQRSPLRYPGGKNRGTSPDGWTPNRRSPCTSIESGYTHAGRSMLHGQPEHPLRKPFTGR